MGSVLTKPHQQAFFEQGFVVLRGLFPAAAIDILRQAFDRLEARARQLRDSQLVDDAFFVVSTGPNGMRRIHRVVWCCGPEPSVLSVARDPRLLTAAAELLGSPSIDHLLCQAHFKLPHDQVAYPWHQDSAHRRYGTELWLDRNGRGSYVQSIVAVDPMRADNGPLRVLAGSCAQGHRSPRAGSSELDLTAAETQAALTILLDPGDVLLMGPYTIHSSEPNESDTPRRAFINGYAYPGANRRLYPGSGQGVRLHVPEFDG